MKFRKACCNCRHWLYTTQIELKYGMGVGRCNLNGDVTFCDHGDCVLHELTGKAEI